VTAVISARRTALPLLAVLAVLLAGCGGEPVQPTPTASVTNPSAADSAAPAAPVVKRTVLLDPGHNGGNGTHPDQINKKVPDGRGGTKPCNTTGTATDAGYPEHKFNWDVALRVGELLLANGVNAKLTRTNDTGVGPCVDVRGEMAEKMNVDAEVSIHADGAPPSGKGFHVAYPRPALNTAQGAPSLALATALRDALHGAGLPESTYLGKAGLFPRADLAGLNTSKRPIALVECANMRNPDEAVTVSNPAGRQRYAQAITIGILAWLSHLPAPSTTAAKHPEAADAPDSASTPDSTAPSSSAGTSGGASGPSSSSGSPGSSGSSGAASGRSSGASTSGSTGTGVRSPATPEKKTTTDSATSHTDNNAEADEPAEPPARKPSKAPSPVSKLDPLGGNGSQGSGPLG
jgi:N-acetylmuramoyl-L-alanine amidase